MAGTARWSTQFRLTPVSEMATRAQPAAQATYRTVLPGAAMIAVSFGLARYGYGLLLPEMQAELSISPSAAGLIASGTYAS